MMKIFLLMYIMSYVVSEKIGEESDIIVNCREKIRLIGLDKDDQYEFVTAKLTSQIILWCHYCKEAVSYTPKIWYKQNRLTDESPVEVELGMDPELTDNRIYNKPDHTLVINNVNERDAALYYCHGPNTNQQNFKYNYMVDVVPQKIPLRTGTTENWKNYTHDVLNVINEQFKSSSNVEYSTIRKLGIKIHLVFESTRWGTCNGCIKIRKRFSECRMKTQPLNTTSMNTTFPQSDNITEQEEKLLNSFALSCHSLLFAKYYPNISSELMKIENYVFTEPCYAPCRMEGPSTAPKYRNTIVLHEGDHLTLTCPEATFESNVVWMKDGITVASNSVEGNIRVDSLNNLYISHATHQEQANYTCFIDDKKIQEVIVVVHVKSIINTEAFLRHIQYLGFIFIFSVIFYTAGLIITYTRRDTFKKIDFDKLPVETRWDRNVYEEPF